MKRCFFVFPMAAALVLISTARGEEAPNRDGTDAAAMFAKLDANQDGKLTADEVPQDRKQLFERLVRIADKDGDGVLVVAEFVAGLQPAEEPKVSVAAESREERRAAKGKNKGQNRPEIGQVLKRLDANSDGKVTMDEVPENRREQFGKLLSRLDKNGDKELSRDEFPNKPRPDGTPAEGDKPEAEKGKPGKAGGDALRIFSRLDKNSDGKLTADEAPAERAQFISRMIDRGDKDGDKAISLAEFVAVGRERMQQGGPDGKRPERPAGGPEGRPRGLIAALDADHDGKLSSAEVSAASDALRKLDTDGDGELTPRELFEAAGPKN